MKKVNLRQLTFKKEVVAKLTKSDMKAIHGGQVATIVISCGRLCQSGPCTGINPTDQYCDSFAEGPTCGGTVCGSNQGCYSNDICTGFEVPTLQVWFPCSYCVC